MTVGAHVRTLRRAHKLSAEQLAVKAGVSASTVGRLERDNAIPKARLFAQIAAALDTDAASLLQAS